MARTLENRALDYRLIAQEASAEYAGTGDTRAHYAAEWLNAEADALNKEAKKWREK